MCEGRKRKNIKLENWKARNRNAEVGIWKWEVGMRKWEKNDGEKLGRSERKMAEGEKIGELEDHGAEGKAHCGEREYLAEGINRLRSLNMGLRIEEKRTGQKKMK